MQPSTGAARTNRLLALLLSFYGLARVLQLYAGRVPTLLIVVLHVVPPALFALVHGSITYRPRGILIFTALCLGVGTFFESLSLRTGFPFGHYYFTSLMGPKLSQLPILLALAYLGMGYLSWIVAVVLVGFRTRPDRSMRMIGIPLIASLVMVSWDLAMDPVWADIDRAWVWIDGGPYFGVPLSNFAGWFLSVFTFYVGFAVYLRDKVPEATSKSLPKSHWLLAVLFYGMSAAGNLLLSAPVGKAAIFTDPSGVAWRASDILANCTLVSVFTMGAFALIAGARLWQEFQSGRVNSSTTGGS